MRRKTKVLEVQENFFGSSQTTGDEQLRSDGYWTDRMAHGKLSAIVYYAGLTSNPVGNILKGPIVEQQNKKR